MINFLRRFKNTTIIDIKNIKGNKYNYNIEENLNYKKNFMLAENQRKEILEKKSKEGTQRKKKVYDRVKVDYDISNYFLWREFEDVFEKDEFFSYRIKTKILIEPYLLVKAFGLPTFAYRNDKTYTTGEYDFLDSNLDQFVLYDSWLYDRKISNKRNDHNQKHLLGQYERLYIDDIRTKEFWESKEKHEFRVISTDYADFHKFKTFIYKQCNKALEEDYSFHEEMVKRYGEVDYENNKDKHYELNKEPIVYKLDKTMFKDCKLDFKNDSIKNYMNPKKALEDKFLIK